MNVEPDGHGTIVQERPQDFGQCPLPPEVKKILKN